VASKRAPLAAISEDWLRRIALSRSLAVVPDSIASELVASGLAQRFPEGTLAATAAGRQYLDERGISTLVTYEKRA
jgi:hypothetical protein